jgi:cytochrome b
VNHEAKIKVWDPVVRIFHWSLVSAFIIAYATEEDFLSLHVWAGYTVLSLIFLRVLWGFVGTQYARFTDFVHTPQTIKQFLLDTLRLRAARYLGHNPAGGAMIILLLLALVMTTLSGLAVYAVEDAAGPLAGLLSGAGDFWGDVLKEFHEVCANLTVFLVLLHIAGVIVESLIHRENLVGAMWHGYKRKANCAAEE